MLSKKGIWEPSQLGSLFSSHGGASPDVVMKVCGGTAERQALFTTAVAAQAIEVRHHSPYCYLKQLPREVGHMAATCSVAHCARRRALSMAAPQTHAPSQYLLRQFAQWQICSSGAPQPVNCGKGRSCGEKSSCAV